MSDTDEQVTLSRGKTVEVNLLTKDGSKQKTVTIEQFRFRDWQDYSTLVLDEIEMVAKAVKMPRPWVESLDPASYTKLAKTLREVNADFFEYCNRQMPMLLALARPMIGEALANGLPALPQTQG